MITDTITIIASITGILGVYQFLIFIGKYCARPIIQIGMLPHDEISREILKLEDIGKRSGADEFLFHDDIFAEHFDGDYASQSDTPKSMRSLQYNQSEEYDIPIIIYNKGRSTLPDYKLTISFNESSLNGTQTDTKIKLINVETETAEIDGLYVDPDLYTGKEKRERIPSEKIRNSYETIGLSANFVTLRGELSSGIYEMVHLTLKIPKEISQVSIFYEVDSKGEIPKAIRYVQLLRIENNKLGGPEH